jgi:methylenetetrahydrofolate--tRNA-(uracil-5-)-methyltransferase
VVSDRQISVIGGGLAGCEAAWQASKRGCKVVLFEMKPERFSPAHHSPGLAELVCSNSFRSNSLENASGLLKEEMRHLDSLVTKKADENKVPAGAALAVDRKNFSDGITKAIESNPKITVIRKETKEIPESGIAVVATGPLTSDSFSAYLKELIGEDFLYFHDAISPIVEADSIDLKRTFKASRYNKGNADYINCPLSQSEYYRFIEELLGSDKVPLRDFEILIPYEGCMPIEVMAERGAETLAHGPMKPVGLIDPSTGRQPYAVVQLRQENKEATLYNLVGFQTRLKWPEQKRVFSMIPGLEGAEFARFGSLHQNTYIHSPLLLLESLQLKKLPRVFFAGQITGVEGYMESAAMGLVAGIQASLYVEGRDPVALPPTTVMGGLLSYITEP